MTDDREPRPDLAARKGGGQCNWKDGLHHAARQGNGRAGAWRRQSGPTCHPTSVIRHLPDLASPPRSGTGGLQGLVATARGKHPVPSRTRPLSPAAPMVLRPKTRESRSPPDLSRSPRAPCRPGSFSLFAPKARASRHAATGTKTGVAQRKGEPGANAPAGPGPRPPPRQDATSPSGASAGT
jgi:hypothetical protein